MSSKVMSPTELALPPSSAPPTRESFIRRLTRRLKSNPDSSAAREARSRVAEHPPLPPTPSSDTTSSLPPDAQQNGSQPPPSQTGRDRKKYLFPTLRQRSKSSAQDSPRDPATTGSNDCSSSSPPASLPDPGLAPCPHPAHPQSTPQVVASEPSTIPAFHCINSMSLTLPHLVPLPLSRRSSATNLVVLASDTPIQDTPSFILFEEDKVDPKLTDVAQEPISNIHVVKTSPANYLNVSPIAEETTTSGKRPGNPAPARSDSSRTSSPPPDPITPVSPTAPSHSQGIVQVGSLSNSGIFLVSEDGIEPSNSPSKEKSPQLNLEGGKISLFTESPPQLEKALSLVEETEEQTAEAIAPITTEEGKKPPKQENTTERETKKVKRRPTLNLLGLGSGVSRKKSLFGIRRRSSSPEIAVSPGKQSPVSARLPLSPTRQETASPGGSGGANLRHRVSIVNRLSRPSLENEAMHLPTRKPMDLSIQSAGHVSTQMDVLRASAGTYPADSSSKQEVDDETTRLTESAFFF